MPDIAKMPVATQIPRSRGFSLLELTIVLIIIGLVGGMLLSMAMTMNDGQRTATTRAKLAAIDAALVSFVAINRRLPCPADGAAAAGLEVFGTQDNPCANQARGVVPWVTLGISSADVEDGWGTRITYRLDPYLARTNAMDMSMCDPAGTGAPILSNNPPRPNCAVTGGTCTTATLNYCVRPSDFLAGKGLEIRDAVGGVVLMNPAPPSSGAAYALISHGENRAGGFSDGGIVLQSVKGIEGVNETQNRADTSLAYYIDAPQRLTSDASRFDDFIIRPSVISVIQRAHLGPRSH